MNKLPSIETFEKQLAITHPWKINDIKSIPSEKNRLEIHVFLSFIRGSIFQDYTGTPRPLHSTYDKTWQHIDFQEQHCYIHCKVPLIKTTEENIITIDVPWARTGSRFSWAFETNVIQNIQNGIHFDKIGSLFGKTSPRIWTIFNGWVNTAYEIDIVNKDLSILGIYEILDQAKDKQITITIDLKNKRVLRVSQGTGKEAMQDICSYLENKGIPTVQIRHVSGALLSERDQYSDLFSNMKAYFPNTEYHVDRLYITQLLNDAVDQVRKKESYRTKKLTEARALFVKHPALLSEKQKNEVQKLLVQFPNVGQVYALKNTFFALWDQSSPHAAEAFLESWCQEVSKTRLSPLKNAAQRLKAHKQHIVRFSALPTESTTMEKIHENIRAATKRTKGLKNFENVSNMILFCCGKLTFPYSQF